MPLETAKRVLEDPNATAKELYDSIMALNRRAGDLGCQSNKDPDLLRALLEIEKTIGKLEERYNSVSTSN